MPSRENGIAAAASMVAPTAAAPISRRSASIRHPPGASRCPPGRPGRGRAASPAPPLSAAVKDDRRALVEQLHVQRPQLHADLAVPHAGQGDVAAERLRGPCPPSRRNPRRSARTAHRCRAPRPLPACRRSCRAAPVRAAPGGSRDKPEHARPAQSSIASGSARPSAGSRLASIWGLCSNRENAPHPAASGRPDDAHYVKEDRHELSSVPGWPVIRRTYRRRSM